MATVKQLSSQEASESRTLSCFQFPGLRNTQQMKYPVCLMAEQLCFLGFLGCSGQEKAYLLFVSQEGSNASF